MRGEDTETTRKPSGPYTGKTIEPFYPPVRYPSNEAFLGIFGADLEKARALLPSDDLHPVRITPGRAGVAVSAMLFRYAILDREDGVALAGTAYGEMGFSVLCTFGEQAPPFVPLAGLPLRDTWQAQLFIVHLPVTTIEAWEAGRVGWNAPKFVADMDFELGPDECTATLAEGGERILRLKTRRGGITRRDRDDLVFYASMEGNLLRTTCDVDGVQQIRFGGRSGRLELGDHAIADELRAIDIDTRPMAVRTYLRHSLVLPAGEIVGPAKPYDGWLRDEEPRRGRLVLHYPGTAPIDVYSVTPDETRPASPADA